MAAFLVYDVAEDIYHVPENLSHCVLSGPTADANQFCSLLDRCGMSVIIDQVTLMTVILLGAVYNLVHPIIPSFQAITILIIIG